MTREQEANTHRSQTTARRAAESGPESEKGCRHVIVTTGECPWGGSRRRKRTTGLPGRGCSRPLGCVPRHVHGHERAAHALAPSDLAVSATQWAELRQRGVWPARMPVVSLPAAGSTAPPSAVIRTRTTCQSASQPVSVFFSLFFCLYLSAFGKRLQRTGMTYRTTPPFDELINRHTYTYGILEGIGVCVGVPAKRGQTQDTNGRAQPKKAVNGYLSSAT